MGFPKWKSGLIINARSETAEQAHVSRPFRKRRLLFLQLVLRMEKDMENEKAKIKHWISINNQLFYMAGLYWFFRDRMMKLFISRFTILTTEANHKMQPIHNRMPVIIPEESIEKWLNAKDINDILPMLVPPDDNETFISQIA